MCGRNRYGHPADEAMDRLMDAKCRIYTQCKVVRLSIKRVLYMKTIDNDIKAGDFKKVYLLYGQERYLIKQYRDKLIKAMVSEGDSMNFSSFEGDGINQKEIIDLAETLPFLRIKE